MHLELISVKMLSAVHLDSFSTSNCLIDLWTSQAVYFKYDIGVNLFLKTELEERRDCRVLVMGIRRILMNSRVHNSCIRSLIGRILQITSSTSADETVCTCDLSTAFILYLFHQSDTFLLYRRPSSNSEF